MSNKNNPKVEWGFYASTPRIIRTHYKQLSHTEKWLYVCLKDLCGDKGVCYRTLKVLAQETDLSTGNLSTGIRHLHEAGLIHAEKKRRSNKPTQKEVWHISIVDIWQANAECSKNERFEENVQEMNNNVQNMNEPPLERSNSEQQRSNFVDRRITLKNNTNEERTVEEESTSSPSLDVDAHTLDHSCDENCPTCEERRTREELETDVKEVHADVKAKIAVQQAQLPTEQGADDDGQRTHIAPILQHGGAASANPPGGSRAPEGKTKRKTQQQQNGTQEDAPMPKCDTKEIQRRINAHRGYALEEKVAIIRERDAIKSWCNLHPLEDYERVMKRLKNDPYWGKEENYRRIGGRQLLTETPRILAELAQEQERPPQEKTMSGLPRLVPLGVKL